MERLVTQSDDVYVALVHSLRLVPKNDECAKELKKRMLTNLYYQPPT